MDDLTTAFFERLTAQGRSPLLLSESGTLRFDLVDGDLEEFWYVTIKKGDVSVSREDRAADCMVRAEKTLFNGMVTGKVNATAAALRDALTMEGNAGLFLVFQRLFPGPVGAESDKPQAGYAKRRQ
ncbi:MAG TPA: SCP2 sterol-binding domain-containing protein [Thermoleophilia bacterium]